MLRATRTTAAGRGFQAMEPSHHATRPHRVALLGRPRRAARPRATTSCKNLRPPSRPPGHSAQVDE
eukprot:7413939-Pyramimonas_sp.AAC.1